MWRRKMGNRVTPLNKGSVIFSNTDMKISITALNFWVSCSWCDQDLYTNVSECGSWFSAKVNDWSSTCCGRPVRRSNYFIFGFIGIHGHSNTEQVARLSRAEMRMVRCMCGVPLRERKTNAELRKSLGIKDIGEVMRWSRLRWMGHVLRKDMDDWVRRSMEMVIEGKRGMGRPRMTWVKAVESDMRVKKGLMREDAEDQTKWRAMSWRAKG